MEIMIDETEKPAVMTADQFRKTRQNPHAGTTVLPLPMGGGIRVRVIGGMATPLLTQALGMSGEEMARINPWDWNKVYMENVDRIAENILPRVVVEPVVVPSNATEVPEGALRVSEFSRPDKWAIVDYLIEGSSGAKGAAIAEKFLREAGGAVPRATVVGDEGPDPPPETP